MAASKSQDYVYRFKDLQGLRQALNASGSHQNEQTCSAEAADNGGAAHKILESAEIVPSSTLPGTYWVATFPNLVAKHAAYSMTKAWKPP